MQRINVEIKAKCNNQDMVRSVLKAHKADFIGTDHQIDTYFTVPTGRLKLREGNIENYLVFYERKNTKGPKQANVILYESKSESSLKAVLTKSLGVLVVVDKLREIYFIDNVKFHIDTVKKLGSFVEIEAVGVNKSLSKDKLLKQCEHYLKLLGVAKKDLVPVSYSDLLLQKS